MSDLIEVTPLQTPVPQRIADQLLAAMNAEADRRVGIHRDSFRAFWESSEATPQEIADAMGTNAGLFFALASENVEHISRSAVMVGKTLADFLQANEYTPPRAVTYHADGTVTIAEAE